MFDFTGLFAELAGQRPNILSLSSGGFGHIPIPLIMDEMNFTSPPSNFTHEVGE